MRQNKIKFIYWFAYYNLASPSVRYRARYPLDFFKSSYNIGSFLVIPGYAPAPVFLFLKAYLSALLFRKRDSLIVIQRVQSDFIYASLLKLLVLVRNSDTVYDLDDADYLDHPPKTIYFFAKNCNTVSAGSDEIVNHLIHYNNSIVHNTSPVCDLNIVKKQKNPLFTIGWIGSFGGGQKESLCDLVFPALKILTFDFRFVLIGVSKPDDLNLIRDYFENCPNIKIEIQQNIDWLDENSIQQKIVNFDIGLATLTNSPVQLAKSGIKAKQYLNNGIPVLSTNLPENNKIIINDVNGYLCNNTNDFTERLIHFYNMDEDKYMEFSKRSRASIINFDHNKYLQNFEKIVNPVE